MPGPITGMKPGLCRTIGASRDTKPSPGPKMIEGRKIVQSRPDARTAFSPAALLRPYSEGESSELPMALMWSRPAHARSPRGGDGVLRGLAVHAVEGLAPLLVDDPDEVDERLAARSRAGEGRGIEDVPGHGLDRAVVPVARLRRIARQDRDLVAPLEKLVDDMGSDESRAAGDENAQAHLQREHLSITGTKYADPARYDATAPPLTPALSPYGGRGRSSSPRGLKATVTDTRTDRSRSFFLPPSARGPRRAPWRGWARSRTGSATRSGGRPDWRCRAGPPARVPPGPSPR